jgi:hypothetical protein
MQEDGLSGVKAVSWNIADKLCLFLLFLIFFFFSGYANAAPLGGGETDLSGVREGWAWPVIVVQPPDGWESPAGEAVKYGLRAAEREISLTRGGISGFEVTFMFSSVRDVLELETRMKDWRNMKSHAIISFAGGETDLELKRLCSLSGPSIIFAGGEDLAIKNPVNDSPYPYLFALDYTYFARANALAEYAALADPVRPVVVMTDGLSERLARGAEKNVSMLERRGVEVFSYFIPGSVLYQFNAQVQEAVSSGAGVITSWLDSMATLSIWRTVSLGRSGVDVYYSGGKSKMLLDADGLVLVDKDDALNYNEDGKQAIIRKVRDLFGKTPADPVTAAKAYALGKWVLAGFTNASEIGGRSIALSLSGAEGIPLMDEILSIDPRTNRPKSRKYCVLRVEGRIFKPVAGVDVYSVEVIE